MTSKYSSRNEVVNDDCKFDYIFMVSNYYSFLDLQNLSFLWEKNWHLTQTRIRARVRVISGESTKSNTKTANSTCDAPIHIVLTNFAPEIPLRFTGGNKLHLHYFIASLNERAFDNSEMVSCSVCIVNRNHGHFN